MIFYALKSETHRFPAGAFVNLNLKGLRQNGYYAGPW